MAQEKVSASAAQGSVQGMEIPGARGVPIGLVAAGPEQMTEGGNKVAKFDVDPISFNRAAQIAQKNMAKPTIAPKSRHANNRDHLCKGQKLYASMQKRHNHGLMPRHLMAQSPNRRALSAANNPPVVNQPPRPALAATAIAKPPTQTIALGNNPTRPGVQKKPSWTMGMGGVSNSPSFN